MKTMEEKEQPVQTAQEDPEEWKNQSGLHKLPRWLKLSIIALVDLMMIISLVSTVRYFLETQKSEKLTEGLASDVVTVSEAEYESGLEPEPEGPYPEAGFASESAAMKKKEPPVEVDFEALLERNPDAAAWLYSEGTPINLAVMQAEDNQYYLFHTFDRENNGYGTLFLDFNCSGDFSGPVSVIYGHNMNNETMFGTLKHYREDDYPKEHPVMYLLTPEKNYRLVPVAATLNSADSPLYSLPMDRETADGTVPDNIQRSEHDFGEKYKPEANYIVLSTCAYDFTGAFLDVILEMQEIEQR